MDNIVWVVRKIAFELHKNQKYGKESYSYHLDHVYSTFEFLFGYVSKAEGLVVYCHDLKEDCGTTHDDLMSMGLKTHEANSVCLLSKTHGVDRETYILTLAENTLARRVKIADSTSNLIHSLKDGNARLITKYTDNLRMLWEVENEDTHLSNV